MYIYAETIRDEVVVWERRDGERKTKTFPAPFYFYAQDEDGDYESIYGEPLAKYEFNTRKEFTKEKQSMTESGYKLYESDIAPEFKILSREYYGVPSPKLQIAFYDIEVDYDEERGFSSVSDPYAPICAIAIYQDWLNRYVVVVVPPEGQDWNETSLQEAIDDINMPLYGDNPNYELIICKNERELLLNFLVEIEDSDVISGWNSEFFDDPMVGKRIEIVLGKKCFEQLSFKGARKPRWTEVERMGRTEICLDIYGRISFDYLKLVRKYETTERQSYKLESVAEDKLPFLPKLAYKGNLARLYREDFPFFCRYNIRDTEILHGFENLLKYVSLANEMYHLSTGLSPGVFTTLKLSDLSIINHCHHVMNRIVPDGDSIESDESIKGAYVLDPVIGMHENVGAIDINSLYPSAIRSNNISPETLIGQFVETEEAQRQIVMESDVELTLILHSNDTRVLKTAKNWKRILLKNKWSISGYGSVYDQNFEGVIPAVLKDWFEMRKVHKKKQKEYENKIDEIKAKYK